MVDTVINQNDGFVSITAVGGETSLDFDFPLYEKSHIRIIRTRASVETDLVLDTDYTIANDQLEVTAGGEAVLAGSATPAIAGDLYTLLLNVPEERTTDFNQAGDFRAATVNRELDLTTQQIQQLRRDVNKSARLSDTSTIPSLEFPTPESGRVLAWNATEDGLENVTPNTGAYLSVSAFAQTLLDDATAADARTTLQVPFTPASASGAASLGFAEDTDNGANKVTLKAPASIASNADVLLPASGTLATIDGTETLTNKTLTSPVLGFTSNLTEYAEGTYTVSVTCGTSGTITLIAANDAASYIRVGNIVHVSGILSVSSVSSPVGQLLISLPFPIANLTETSGYSVASIVLDTTVSANAGVNPAYLVEGTSYITGFTNSATQLTNTLANQVKAGTTISFQATYRTA